MSSPAKKPKFNNNKWNKRAKHVMEAGQRGFLVTCNFKQRDCIRESYNILNQYADQLYGPVVQEETAKDCAAPPPPPDDGDVIDDLQKEVDAAAKRKGDQKIVRRFNALDTGVTNCVFIQTDLEDPVELSTRIIRDIAETKKALSRFLLRLVPIEVVCKANPTEILSKGAALFDKHFIKTPSTFAIVFNHRYNDNLSRDMIISGLAEFVIQKNPLNRVDLRTPEKTVIVEVIKGFACLSVVPDYNKYRKYNLVELCKPVEQKPEAEESTEKAAAPKESPEKATEPEESPANDENLQKGD